jgi:hypothetical protein
LSSTLHLQGITEAQSGVRDRKSCSWVISEGKLIRMDPTEFDPEAEQGVVKAYRLSQIGRYLLNPGPIEVRKRLVGCEVHRAPNRLRFLRRTSKRPQKADIILSGLKLKLPSLKDPDLEAHLKRMIDELRGFDPFGNKLARLDTRKVSHLIGICEDGGGGHSYLKLQGSTDDKIRYLNSHVGRDVRVTIHRAHVSEGLFELRGFPAAGFSPVNIYTLFLYSRDGRPAACVLTGLGNLDFRLPDPQVVNYLSLLENTLDFCPGFRKAFDACFSGEARPVHLAFNRQLEVDYSKASFPEVYRDVFRTAQTAAANCNLVKPVLNYLQTTVSLSYLPSETNGDERMLTHLCILHDLRAIEPLRKSLPAVYAEMSRRAFSTEAGRYYVLDSITGAARAD